MKSISLIVSLIAVTFFTSCKKDTKNEPEEVDQQPLSQVSYPNYSNLTVGNYWIYQRFEIDGTGTETTLSVTDSCYIEKDTIINGNKYYKYVSPNFGVTGSPNSLSPNVAEFFRDSLSYMVSSSGRIEFSSEDFTTIFQSKYGINPPSDTIYRFEYKMGDHNFGTNTPSGTYSTSSAKEYYYMYPNYSTGGSVRVRNTRYAQNIGKVTQEWYFFASIPNRWERRLIRYHLN